MVIPTPTRPLSGLRSTGRKVCQSERCRLRGRVPSGADGAKKISQRARKIARAAPTSFTEGVRMRKEAEARRLHH